MAPAVPQTAETLSSQKGSSPIWHTYPGLRFASSWANGTATRLSRGSVMLPVYTDAPEQP